VVVNLLLVQHLENITFDCKLVELANLHLGIRVFLGYELAETQCHFPNAPAPAGRPLRGLFHVGGGPLCTIGLGEWPHPSGRLGFYQRQRLDMWASTKDGPLARRYHIIYGNEYLR
jgi:hypothetical protein